MSSTRMSSKKAASWRISSECSALRALPITKTRSQFLWPLLIDLSPHVLRTLFRRSEYNFPTPDVIKTKRKILVLLVWRVGCVT